MRLVELDTISDVPLLCEKDVELKQTWQPFRLKEFSIFDLEGTWVPARSYAIELLKMQSYPLTDIYFEREAFLQDFTSFIKRILCTRGFCSLAKRPSSEEVRLGTFTIKGSDAFYSLVRPGEYRIY